MNNNYTYDAFISYRHSDLDQFVAENIHKQMETFKLPKSLIKSGATNRKKIERVFRDKDELPLTDNLEDPIYKALIGSEYLVVICTPRLKESEWCKKEIQTFIQYHGREKVLVVLAEGEPKESFPEEMMYVDEPVYYDDGSVKITRKMVEPLAADVRGKNKKEIIKNIKSELLRLLAPMFGVTYDDLRQRQRERRIKRIVTASVSAAAVCLIIGIASTLAALHINNQKKQIEEQNQQIIKQSDEIKAQADEIKSQTDEIISQNKKLMLNQALNLADDAMNMLNNGDRIGAINTAKIALTQYEGIELPYTSSARYALTEALHVYDSGNYIKAVRQYETEGIVSDVFVSKDKSIIVTRDTSDCLTIWNVETGEKLDTIENVSDGETNFKNVCFLDDDTMAYVTHKGEICTYHFSSKESKWENLDIVYANSIVADSQGKYLAMVDGKKALVYDTTNYQVKYRFDVPDGKMMGDELCFIDENTFAFCIENNYLSGDDVVESSVCIVNIATGEIITQASFPYDGIYLLECSNGALYISTILYNDFVSASGSFYKIDAQTGQMIWECKEGIYGNKIKFPESSESSELLLVSSMEAYSIDVNTGDVTGAYYTNDAIVSLGPSGKNYAIITSAGDYCMVNLESKTLVIIDGLLQYGLSNKIDDIRGTDSGIAVLPRNENRVILFSVSENPFMTAYEGNYISTEGVAAYADYTEEAMELGLNNAKLVRTILHISEEGIMVVSYSNKMVEIIDENSLEVLETIENVKNPITKYLKKDKQGNLYIADISYGYCLDSEYHLISKIEELRMVDSEKNVLVVGDEDKPYQIPIYDTEQLLQMADDLTQ